MPEETLNSSEFNKSRLSPYEFFLLTEYNNIAQAHFNTKSSIATFFKHYLLIVSLPISIFLVLLNKGTFGLSDKYIQLITFLVPYIFIAIAIIGFFVMLYIVNLDCDAILYARTVNGIRYYFNKMSLINKKELSNILTLPRSINKPSYTGFHSIIYVVSTFTVINTFYFYLGLMISCEFGNCLVYHFHLLSFAIFLMHFISYWYYIKLLEKKHKSLLAQIKTE